MVGIILQFSIAVLLTSALETNDVRKVLKYYETLKTTDFFSTVRTSRSIDGRPSFAVKHITFFAFGRSFNLVLSLDSSVLASNFQAKAVYADGQTENITINTQNFFSGHLAEDESIHVDAFYEGDVFCTSINFPNETYVTEPSWRYLHPSENHSVIAYRASDVKWDDFGPFEAQRRTVMNFGCDLKYFTTELICFYNRRMVMTRRHVLTGTNSSLPHMPSWHTPYSEQKVPTQHSRENQAQKAPQKFTIEKNTCTLLVVADYRFFKDNSHDNTPSAVAETLIGTLKLVNTIFKNTVWRSGLTGMGFAIKEMIIHREPSPNPNSYNSVKTYWNVSDLISAFSVEPRMDFYCLAHLFTSVKFREASLGYAFMADPNPKVPGGICSLTHLDTNTRKIVYSNVGLTTARHPLGGFLLSLQRHIVTAHEFGHNWGAAHDKRTSMLGETSCVPSNGKYLMWFYSVPGTSENNFHFSPCSIFDISIVLEARSYCFIKQPLDGWCGDGLLNSREQCDAGSQFYDPCCTPDCLLRKNATCSDFNYDCCFHCQTAPLNHLCEDENLFTCKNASYCNGVSLICPKPESFKDGTPCVHYGTCMAGTCKPYCSMQTGKNNNSLTSCNCVQDEVSACRVCCMEKDDDNRGGICLPIHFLPLPLYHFCYLGYCDENNICKAQMQALEQIIIFFKTLTAGKFAKFAGDNIVIFVLISSALFWIPGSLFIHYKDMQLKRKRKAAAKLLKDEDMKQESKQNVAEELLKDKDMKQKSKQNVAEELLKDEDMKQERKQTTSVAFFINKEIQTDAVSKPDLDTESSSSTHTSAFESSSPKTTSTGQEGILQAEREIKHMEVISLE